ncbi:MAG: hypothetical protein JO082_02775 [Mycobacterium sp.]|nr:hypothetical protein [Mycobacterium sp.]
MDVDNGCAVEGFVAGTSGPLRSASVLTFGADNVLFVGDITGAVVHAFALRPADTTPQHDVELGNFHNFEGRDLVIDLDHQLAGLLGTTYEQIAVNALAVHQPSQQIFVAVERGRSTDAVPAVIKVNHGELEVFDLSGIPHTSVAIPHVPSPDAQLEFDTQRSFAITDITYYDGEIFVSGVSNQRFASTLHRIRYPFTSQLGTSTVEIWHSVHGQFETRAPIIRHLVFDVGGQPHLYGVYGCTPLVRFPLAALTDGAHVRGEVIGQLGYGANPLDMFVFHDPSDQQQYLVVTIDTRGASKLAAVDLASAPAQPTGGPIDFQPWGLGQTQTLMPVHSDHTAMINSKWAVVIQRHKKTQYRRDISSMAAPYFFERKDGMSEMNWPDGPDPFHYREHSDEIDCGSSS